MTSGSSPIGTKILSKVHLMSTAMGPTISCIVIIFDCKNKDKLNIIKALF